LEKTEKFEKKIKICTSSTRSLEVQILDSQWNNQRCLTVLLIDITESILNQNLRELD